MLKFFYIYLQVSSFTAISMYLPRPIEANLDIGAESKVDHKGKIRRGC
ncbi:hypothetical protein H098_28290 [Pseudomonas fluorescens FH5]|nr:hypothetical protein H098_28290 [Pseudomonas fluorescens FH5]